MPPEKVEPAVVDEQANAMPGSPITKKFQVTPCHNPIKPIVTSWQNQDHHVGWKRFSTGSQGTGQRIENIGPEPLGQGNMPAIPESGQVGLEVGMVEILGKLNPHQAADANGQYPV